MQRGLALVVWSAALALRLVIPVGFMPGTSFAEPVMLCADGAAMAAMPMPAGHGGTDHDPARTPHGATHHCTCVGHGPAPLPGSSAAADVRPAHYAARLPAAPASHVAPDRGMAAPPPPPRAPPLPRA